MFQISLPEVSYYICVDTTLFLRTDTYTRAVAVEETLGKEPGVNVYLSCVMFMMF